jgi:GT2 family glycosyltransferase
MSITSILIPVFNKFPYTKSCLEHLFRLPTDEVEIIVCDNASTDETQNELQKITQSNFHYIRNEVNGGFAVGCNKSYAKSTGDNIVFLNNDIRVKDDSWLETLTNAIEDNTLVGPTGGFVDPKKDFAFAYETSDPNKQINYMSGWLLCANRATWQRLNIPRENNEAQIFSEEFWLYYEDTDLGLRSQQLGIKFKIVPNLPIVHFGKVSSKQVNTNKWYNLSRQIFLNKWKGKNLSQSNNSQGGNNLK